MAVAGTDGVDAEERRFMPFALLSLRGVATRTSGESIESPMGVTGADFVVSMGFVLPKGFDFRRLLSLRGSVGSSGVLGWRWTAEVDCESGEGVTVLWRVCVPGMRERGSDPFWD